MRLNEDVDAQRGKLRREITSTLDFEQVYFSLHFIIFIDIIKGWTQMIVEHSGLKRKIYRIITWNIQIMIS